MGERNILKMKNKSAATSADEYGYFEEKFTFEDMSNHLFLEWWKQVYQFFMNKSVQ